MAILKRKLDTEKILKLVAQVRASIPAQYRSEPKPRKVEDTRSSEGGNLMADAEEEFELLTVAEALSDLADELNASIQKANEKLLNDCLTVYYRTEELAKDPANAHLLPHLKEMRKAYEESYGKPIPPKKQ